MSIVLPGTYSISSLAFFGPENQPALGLEGVHLDQVRVVEHLPDAELVLGLLQVLQVVLRRRCGTTLRAYSRSSSAAADV